jgi:hypothetical protein
MVTEGNGLFITAAEIYFRTKDLVLPVTVQLRPMQNGYPTNEVYPFGEVVLDSEQVITSDDASLATKVTFPSPVYLHANTEHSIVLLSESNEYTVWISKLGEVDVESLNEAESRQVLVSQQPDLGSLFKSQNGSTWTASQYEDLKLTLFSANFDTTSTGNVSFYNPRLDKGNNQIAKLVKDALEFESKKVVITTSEILNVSSLVIGNTISQKNARVTGDYVGYGGSATGELSIINAGIGYTPSDGSFLTYDNVPLTSLSGVGKNATANITIGANGGINGIAIGATINQGGFGYRVGDLLTIDSIGSEPLGRNIQFTLDTVNGINQLIIDNVQGEFENNISKPLQYNDTISGITTILDSNGLPSVIDDIELNSIFEDGLHIKVNHKNHGMHSDTNVVLLSNVRPDVKGTRLVADYSFSDSGPISIANTSTFTTFENAPVSPSNPGYAEIGREIISYTGVENGQLIGITRGIDSTRPFSNKGKTRVRKYENNGISLRRINKIHYLSDALVPRSIGLDYYYIKLDMSKNGIDRTSDPSLYNLYINSSKADGGSAIRASQNIQYEAITPIVQTMVLPETNVTASIKSITGTSVDGNEVSFLETPITPVKLNETNYLTEPRVITSTVNESIHETSLPANKSLELTLNLSSADYKISPVIDLDRVGVILTTNRVNSAIEDYVNDPRVASIDNDPSEFVYVNKLIELENPATSLKVIFDAYVNTHNDVRVFYSVGNSIDFDPIYYPFPGYNNIDLNGNVIDLSLSNGLPDKKISKTDVLSSNSANLPFAEYQFNIDDLPEFRYFSIKIIGTSTNQAYPPRIKDLRIIALA